MTQTHELRDVSNFLNSGKQPTYESPQTPSATPSIVNSDPPDHAVSALERWNGSKANIFKTASTFFGCELFHRCSESQPRPQVLKDSMVPYHAGELELTHLSQSW